MNDQPKNLFSFENLDELLSFGSLIELGFSLLFLALLFWGANVGIAFLWRLGFDREHRLVAVRKGIKIGGVLWVIYWGLSKAVASLPVLSVVFASLLVAGAIYAAVEPMQSLFAALGTVFRSRLKPGDRITIGKLEGTVVEMDWLNVALSQPNGVMTWVPLRLVHREGLIRQSRRNAFPVHVEFPRDQFAFAGRSLEQLREQVLLSPFRTPGTDVDVKEEYHGVTVDFLIWDSDCATEAQEHVRRSVSRYLPSTRLREHS